MKAIRVHDWQQVAAVLEVARELGQPPILLSPQAGQCGIGWWRELIRRARESFPDMAFETMLDCGPSAGLAQAAIRDGAGPVAVMVSSEVLEKLSDIARQAGTLATEGGKPALDLAGMSDVSRTCRDWLTDQGAVPKT